MCGMPIQPVSSFPPDDLASSSFSVLPFIITILYTLGFSSSSSPLVFTDITDQRVIQMPSGEFFFLIELTLKNQFLDHSSLSNYSASSASLYATLQPVARVSADFSTSNCSSSHLSAAQSVIVDTTVTGNQDSIVGPALVSGPIDAIRTGISVHMTPRHNASVGRK